MINPDAISTIAIMNPNTMRRVMSLGVASKLLFIYVDGPMQKYRKNRTKMTYFCLNFFNLWQLQRLNYQIMIRIDTHISRNVHTLTNYLFGGKIRRMFL